MRSKTWQYRGACLALASLLAANAVQGQQAQPSQGAQPAPQAPPPGDIRVSTMAAQPPATPELEMKDDSVQLALNQAVEIALQQNLGIVIERYARTQRRLGIIQALGIYDLVADATLQATDEQQAVVATTDAGSQNQQVFNFGFAQRIPTGGNVTFGWDNSRTESNARNRDTPTSFNSGFNFAYTQSLLQNFGRLAFERNLVIAQTNSRISRQEFERIVTETVQDVENAYWNLVNAREQLVVAQQSLALARELNDRNRIQVEVGTLAPLEMVQSEAAIATRDEDIIRATSAIGDAEDELRRLLNLPTTEGLWQKPIVPTTAPETERISIDLAAAINTALEERPELRTQELQLAQAQLDAEFFRHQLRPQLNLTANYGNNGTGVGFQNAFNQVTGFDFRGWGIRLDFLYPIQNRTARAQSAAANLDFERVRTLLDQQKTLISTEVRRAARAVDTAAKQIDAARISLEFQNKNLDAERKRYENGMSTSFQITQIQDDLTQARSRQVQATINYRTALAEYYRSIGRLLEQQGIAVDDPGEPDWEAQRFSFSRAPLPGEGRR
ncbi:MAG TPA: TolC family protein [Thermoanaerobaculia bacterium]|nr:TolC family protein [Thermoanaerobaculia bacterium]